MTLSFSRVAFQIQQKAKQIRPGHHVQEIIEYRGCVQYISSISSYFVAGTYTMMECTSKKVVDIQVAQVHHFIWFIMLYQGECHISH